MNISVAISIASIIAIVIYIVLMERRIRVRRLNRAIQDTINSIEKGKSCRGAIFEDFPTHEQLVMNLLPFLLFLDRRRTEMAFRNYRIWYKTIDVAHIQTVAGIFGPDSQGEINATLKCLENLKKKV